MALAKQSGDCEMDAGYAVTQQILGCNFIVAMEHDLVQKK